MNDVIQNYCKDNQNLFLDVARTQNRTRLFGVDKSLQYNILNYDKILNDLCEYLKGFVEYSKSGDNKYDTKILTQTKLFFDAMFTSKDYRTKIVLGDFNKITEDFVEKSSKLRDMLKSYASEEDSIKGLGNMLVMTENQFNKIGKVFRDDSKLYLWQCGKARGGEYYRIDQSLRNAFSDKSTPVMHPESDVGK